jgi:glutaminase
MHGRAATLGDPEKSGVTGGLCGGGPDDEDRHPAKL